MEMKNSGVEWIGEIPESWTVSEIQYKFEQVKNKNLGNKEKNLLSLSYGKIVQKNIETSAGLLPESFETYNIVEKDDVVFRLTDLQNDQKSLRVGLAKEHGIITSAYITLHPKTINEIDPRYFFYLFYDYDIQKVFYGMGAGVRQGLTFDELKRLKILVPSALAEQKAIADYLDKQSVKFDKAQQLLTAEIDRLRTYKKSLIYETVTKGLDKTAPLKDSGVDWIGEIPVGWEVSKLKYIATYDDEQVTQAEIDSGKIIQYVDISSVDSTDGITNYQEMSLTDAPSRARKRVKVGDTIVSTVRTYLKAIAYVEKDKDVVVSTGFQF